MSVAGLFNRFSGRAAKALAVIGATGWLAQASMYNVDAGHRAIIYDHLSGIKERVYGEGTHFLIPGLQYPIIMDVRSRPRTLSSITGTKDLQQVNVSLRLLSRPVESKLMDVYTTLGQDYDERILPSIGNEVLKAVVAQYNADQLLALRDKVSAAIRASLTQRAAEYNLLLDDVSITHLAFSTDFAAAIEHKEVAYQQAETAKFVVQKAEQERKALVIQSEGDAEAAQMVSDAISKHGRGLIEIRRIETAQTVANVLSKSPNVVYLPSSGNILLNPGNMSAPRAPVSQSQ